MKKLAAMLLLGAACGAFAAGGHHAVDDAAILEPGQCELESWFGRARGEKLLHAGGACRVGPVELGAAAEYGRLAGAGSQTGWGLQAKWAHELGDGFSIGASLTPGWQAHVRPRYQATTVAALATWAPGEALALHLNLGRDLVHSGPDLHRSGMAIEWTPRTGWTLLAERYLEEQTHFARAGLRWTVGGGWSVDLSRTQSLRGPNPSMWTLGLTWLLDGR